MHKRVKLAVAVVVLISALSYLAVAGIAKGRVYYMDVDTFLATAQRQGPATAEATGRLWGSQPVRVCGDVAEDNVQIQPPLAKFELVGRTGRLAVVYRGALPNLFQPGCQVVAEGRLQADGTFVAEVLMTKCASKYRPAPATRPKAEVAR